MTKTPEWPRLLSLYFRKKMKQSLLVHIKFIWSTFTCTVYFIYVIHIMCVCVYIYRYNRKLVNKLFNWRPTDDRWIGFGRFDLVLIGRKKTNNLKLKLAFKEKEEEEEEVGKLVNKISSLVFFNSSRLSKVETLTKDFNVQTVTPLIGLVILNWRSKRLCAS